MKHSTNGELFAPERGAQDHCTPSWLAEIVALHFGVTVGSTRMIALDPCANPWTRVRAWRRVMLPKYRPLVPPAEADDIIFDSGLTVPWSRSGPAYVNPPYNDILPWVTKAADERARGAHSIFAVPCDPSTMWWRRFWATGDAACLWGKRIAWEGAGGDGAKQPMNLLYWGDEPRRFRSAFARYGAVLLTPRHARLL